MPCAWRIRRGNTAESMAYSVFDEVNDSAWIGWIQVMATIFDAVQHHQSFALWHNQELRKQRAELYDLQVHFQPTQRSYIQC